MRIDGWELVPRYVLAFAAWLSGVTTTVVFVAVQYPETYALMNGTAEDSLIMAWVSGAVALTFIYTLVSFMCADS